MSLLGSAHKETKHVVNDQWIYCVISELKSDLMNYFLEYDNLPLCVFFLLYWIYSPTIVALWINRF